MREFYEDVWAQMPEGLEPPARERRLAFLLGHVSAGDRVLDLGCGEGAFTAALARHGADAVGIDVAEGALDRARAAHPGLRFELAPPHGPLPLDDASLDAVWASEVIEHVADTARWLSEVRRVLVSGGSALLTTPYHGRVKNVAIALTGFESHADPVGQHLRFYTRRSLHGLLEDFSFEGIEIAAAGGAPLLRESLHAVARRPGCRRDAG